MALILAAATTAGTSSDVVVPAGSVANIIAFATTAPVWLPSDYLTVVIDTDGLDADVVVLTQQNPGATVRGPGTFRVVRHNVSVPIGASANT